VPQVISFIICLIFNKNRRWLGRARLFKWVARYPLNWMNKIYRWRPTELVTTAERLRVCAEGVLASEICVVYIVNICHRHARSLDGCHTCYLRREKRSLFKIGMKGTRERREALIRGRTCVRAQVLREDGNLQVKWTSHHRSLFGPQDFLEIAGFI
jgi:hypothetical protein